MFFENDHEGRRLHGCLLALAAPQQSQPAGLVVLLLNTVSCKRDRSDIELSGVSHILLVSPSKVKGNSLIHAYGDGSRHSAGGAQPSLIFCS